MSDLSPELKQLVLAGKNASRPTDADSARVLGALRARLGDAALLGAETGQAAAGSSTGFLFSKVAGIGIAGLAVIGGLWFFAARNQRVVSSEPQAIPSVAATISAEAALVPSAAASNEPVAPQLDLVAASGSNKADRGEARTSTSHHARDNLSEEVAILSRAETELHSGKPAAALQLLNEHERKFGNGLLAEERIAARVQALCALGRTTEADVQLARLSPKSLHGEQARQACNSRKGN
jgi:hypothetical protein